MYKSILVLLTLLTICFLPLPSQALMTLDWQNTTATVVTLDHMRNLAYNPITNHLLIANSSGTERGITIVDADNGNVLGSLLAPGGDWTTFGEPSPYGIAVDANGVIYATAGFYSPVQLLRWADETSESTTAAITDATYVRALRVVGTGTATRLIFPSQTDSNVRIYFTSDGLNFTEQQQFNAPESLHDAYPNAAVDRVYVTQGSASTHKWDYISSTWTEDALWNKSGYIVNFALLDSVTTLFGAYWNNIDVGSIDGIRAWNANTGVETDFLGIADTGTVSIRGCAISASEFQTVDITQNSVNASVGQSVQLNASANLSRKLYFAFCGGVGYGRVNLGGSVSGPVWSSNNYSVASVDNTGMVYGLSIGVSTVSVTYTWDGNPYSDSAVVSVIPTSAPLAPDAVSNTTIHQIVPMKEASQLSDVLTRREL